MNFKKIAIPVAVISAAVALTALILVNRRPKNYEELFRHHVNKLQSYREGKGEYHYREDYEGGYSVYDRDGKNWKYTHHRQNDITQALIDGTYYSSCKESGTPGLLECHDVFYPETVAKMENPPNVLPIEVYAPGGERVYALQFTPNGDMFLYIPPASDNKIFAIKDKPKGFSRKTFAGKKADCFDISEIDDEICFDRKTSLPVYKGTVDVSDKAEEITINAIAKRQW